MDYFSYRVSHTVVEVNLFNVLLSQTCAQLNEGTCLAGTKNDRGRWLWILWDEAAGKNMDHFGISHKIIITSFVYAASTSPVACSRHFEPVMLLVSPHDTWSQYLKASCVTHDSSVHSGLMFSSFTLLNSIQFKIVYFQHNTYIQHYFFAYDVLKREQAEKELMCGCSLSSIVI